MSRPSNPFGEMKGKMNSSNPPPNPFGTSKSFSPEKPTNPFQKQKSESVAPIMATISKPDDFRHNPPSIPPIPPIPQIHPQITSFKNSHFEHSYQEENIHSDFNALPIAPPLPVNFALNQINPIDTFGTTQQITNVDRSTMVESNSFNTASQLPTWQNFTPQPLSNEIQIPSGSLITLPATEKDNQYVFVSSATTFNTVPDNSNTTMINNQEDDPFDIKPAQTLKIAPQIKPFTLQTDPIKPPKPIVSTPSNKDPFEILLPQILTKVTPPTNAPQQTNTDLSKTLNQLSSTSTSAVSLQTFPQPVPQPVPLPVPQVAPIGFGALPPPVQPMNSIVGNKNQLPLDGFDAFSQPPVNFSVASTTTSAPSNNLAFDSFDSFKNPFVNAPTVTTFDNFDDFGSTPMNTFGASNASSAPPQQFDNFQFNSTPLVTPPSTSTTTFIPSNPFPLAAPSPTKTTSKSIPSNVEASQLPFTTFPQSPPPVKIIQPNPVLLNQSSQAPIATQPNDFDTFSTVNTAFPSNTKPTPLPVPAFPPSQSKVKLTQSNPFPLNQVKQSSQAPITIKQNNFDAFSTSNIAFPSQSKPTAPSALPAFNDFSFANPPPSTQVASNQLLFHDFTAPPTNPLPTHPTAPVTLSQDDFDLFSFSDQKASTLHPSNLSSTSEIDFLLDAFDTKAKVDEKKEISNPSGLGSNVFGFEDDGQDPFADSDKTDHDALEKLRKAYNLPTDDDDFNKPFDEDEDEDIFGKPMRGTVPMGKRLGGKAGNSSSTGPVAVPLGNLPVVESSDLEGDIMYRMSAKTMVTKDWHEGYYRFEKGYLYLYKSRLDYQFNPKGTNHKYKIPITKNLRLLQIKSKYYNALGFLYNFVLEEVMDYGPRTIGKFSSASKDDVNKFFVILKDQILLARKRATRK